MYWQVVRINVVQHSQLRIDSPTSASGKKIERGGESKLGAGIYSPETLAQSHHASGRVKIRHNIK
jgi:hypothetical protein